MSTRRFCNPYTGDITGGSSRQHANAQGAAGSAALVEKQMTRDEDNGYITFATTNATTNATTTNIAICMSKPYIFIFFALYSVAGPPPQSMVTDHYVMGDLLGEGGYGTVHMATRKAPVGRRDSGKSADAGGRTVKGNGAVDGHGVTPIVKGIRDSLVSTGSGGIAGAEKADTAIGPGTCVAIKKVRRSCLISETLPSKGLVSFLSHLG